MHLVIKVLWKPHTNRCTYCKSGAPYTPNIACDFKHGGVSCYWTVGQFQTNPDLRIVRVLKLPSWWEEKIQGKSPKRRIIWISFSYKICLKPLRQVKVQINPVGCQLVLHFMWQRLSWSMEWSFSIVSIASALHTIISAVCDSKLRSIVSIMVLFEGIHWCY